MRAAAAFRRLRWRHRAIVLCLAAAAAILLARALVSAAGAAEPASACGAPRAPSVSWFRANPRGLDCILAECEENPGAFARTPACITAQSAAFARQRDRLAADGAARRPWGAAPAAPRRPPPETPANGRNWRL